MSTDFNFHSQQQLNKQSKCENKPNYNKNNNNNNNETDSHWQSNAGAHLKQAK